MFLPAEVVLGVAQQLVTSGEVDHGWLGVDASDARPNPSGTAETTTSVTTDTTTSATTTAPRDGARLDVVDAGGPAAAAGLQSGDVVIGIDGDPVHSKAELDTRLYPDAPGTALELTFVRERDHDDGTGGAGRPRAPRYRRARPRRSMR